jgi:uncharacterized membrane protein (UPF0127 family)
MVANFDMRTVIAERVTVARTRLTRAVGLLGRAELPTGEALYIVPSRGIHTWGMRFAVDVAALDDEGVVLGVASNLQPWKLRLFLGCRAVLELPAGTLAKTRTRVGHHIGLVPISEATTTVTES